MFLIIKNATFTSFVSENDQKIIYIYKYDNNIYCGLNRNNRYGVNET